MEEPDENIYYPIHLYTFGDESLLNQNKIKELKYALKRDFGIIDNFTGKNALTNFLGKFPISSKISNVDLKLQEFNADFSTIKSMKALTSCIGAYILTSGVDSGYFEKKYALEILEDISIFVRANFTDWVDFGDNFLIGEEYAKLNNKLGRKILSKYVKYLKDKKGSPWNNINWIKN